MAVERRRVLNNVKEVPTVYPMYTDYVNYSITIRRRIQMIKRLLNALLIVSMLAVLVPVAVAAPPA